MGFISSSFHFILMVHFIYVIYFDLFEIEHGETQIKFAKIRLHVRLGQLKYLTFWDSLLQCVYFTLAFANDIYGTEARKLNRKSDLQKWRDFLFSTLGFSVATFVSVAFWGLYVVDRNLIFPIEMEEWFPNWLNHGVHTVPIIGVFIEVWLVYHKFPKPHTGVITVAMFTALYLLVTCCMAYYWNNYWVYPVLRELSKFGRAIFIASCSFVLPVLYFLGEFLHNLAWGSKKTKRKAY